ncbi:hypothetical protein, partial [Klebsiella pneumoniae]|uniref:hypothetical protein n=1 Tax=Klebsiella pneumoniae TaxID=573 RepID=UPI001C8F3E0D
MERDIVQHHTTSTIKRCVIELQGFRNNSHEFIVKELAIFDIATHVVNYFLFKPPFPFRVLNNKAFRTNRWLTQNFHHLTWDEGFTEYKELTNIMHHYCKQYDEIYTSGLEKSQWIRKFSTRQVINHDFNQDFASELHGF